MTLPSRILKLEIDIDDPYESLRDDGIKCLQNVLDQAKFDLRMSAWYEAADIEAEESRMKRLDA